MINEHTFGFGFEIFLMTKRKHIKHTHMGHMTYCLLIILHENKIYCNFFSNYIIYNLYYVRN